MAVNVSAMEFRHESFLENLFAILAETGLDPRVSRAGADRKRPDEACRVHGVHPSGREGKRGAGGDRRLRHGLLQLELSAKVSRRCPQDRPIVRPSDQHRGDDTTIVTAVIGMARSLKLRVVAEGVETPEEAGISSHSPMRRGARVLFQRAGASTAVRRIAQSRNPETDGVPRCGVSRVRAAKGRLAALRRPSRP